MLGGDLLQEQIRKGKKMKLFEKFGIALFIFVMFCFVYVFLWGYPI